MSVVPTELARAATRVQRPLARDVLAVIRAQQARLAPHTARDAHVRALESGAACVVTGQQVGLFLGPLYTVYKAATAVVLARIVATAAGVPVVPVFWMQTEDHDVPEIASCGLAGEQVAVPVDAANRISIAHLALPPEVDGCVDLVAAHAGDGPQALAHVERLRRHYRAGVRWADAFAGLLSELFGDLVILDPRDELLAAHSAPVHARALREAPSIAAQLLARRDALLAEGKTAPVHVREGAPLAFFHPAGATGPRVRLDPAGDGRYVEAGGDRGDRIHALSELLAALEADPLRFSTSALLRPIVQDSLLPTVAYVGGPAEVAYAAQVSPLYRAFDLVQPAVIRRASFAIVDVRMRALLDRLGLARADVERPESELLAQLRPAGALTADDVMRRLFEPFAAAHAALAAELPDLDRPLARARRSVQRVINKLAGKAERAALYRDTELVAAVRRLRATLAPNGAPQERCLALSAFVAREGDRAFVERVLAAVDPFEPSLKELS